MVRYYARVYNKEGVHVLTTPEESTEDSVLDYVKEIYLRAFADSPEELEGFTYVMLAYRLSDAIYPSVSNKQTNKERKKG